MNDTVDQIMAVMEAAFDPRHGEAWTRRQISDVLLMGNCRYLLAGPDGAPLRPEETAAGFALARRVLDEEELLLLAVSPAWRRRGIASRLIARLIETGRAEGVHKLFLEMREDNPAISVYRRNGFAPIGRRPGYYLRSDGSRVDAITFARLL